MSRCTNGFKYPHADDVKNGRYTKMFIEIDEEPDFIGMAPNYDKFKGWDDEKVRVWLNVD